MTISIIHWKRGIRACSGSLKNTQSLEISSSNDQKIDIIRKLKRYTHRRSTPIRNSIFKSKNILGEYYTFSKYQKQKSPFNKPSLKDESKQKKGNLLLNIDKIKNNVNQSILNEEKLDFHEILNIKSHYSQRPIFHSKTSRSSNLFMNYQMRQFSTLNIQNEKNNSENDKMISNKSLDQGTVNTLKNESTLDEKNTNLGSQISNQNLDKKIENNELKKNVKIIKMMDGEDDIQFDSQNSNNPNDSNDLLKKSVEKVGDDFQIEMKGQPPYSSFEEIMDAIINEKIDDSAVEEKILKFIEDQLDDNVVPDYIFKGLLILYNRTRQYNLQDIIYNQYFFEGSHREVDLDIVNSMIYSYIQRHNINSVQDIMHQYFGWILKNEETGEILDREPKMFPDEGTVYALVSVSGNDLSSEHLEKILEDFKKQSHHGIINQSVIFGFLESGFRQLQLEDYFQHASSWMGYDGFSLTLQSEIRAFGIEDELSRMDTKEESVSENKEDQEEYSRSKELYNWIWNTYYTYFGDKMGDYSWIPNENVLEVVMDASSIIGNTSTTENLYETYFQGEDGLPLNSNIIKALIRSYGKSGQLQKARIIYNRCADQKNSFPEMFTSEIVQEMYYALCQSGEIVEAISDLRKHCTSPSEPNNSVPMTVDILNILLNGFRKLGDYENMISLFEEFCGKDTDSQKSPFISPNIESINYAIESYVRIGEEDVAFQIFNEYCDPSWTNHLPVTLYALELLMHGFIQADKVDHAVALFETYCTHPESPEFCSPTVATIHLILRGLQQKKNGKKSIQIFSTFFSGNIPNLYIEPQTDTLNILLQTLLLDKDFVRAKDVYEEYFSNDNALLPNVETRNIMKNLLIEEEKERERIIQYNDQLRKETEL